MRTKIVSVAVLALAVMGGVLAAPARADCVEVDFEVRYTDRPSEYPLGEPDYCVVPTDWNHTHELHAEDDLDDPQPGLPSGYWIQVWIPLP